MTQSLTACPFTCETFRKARLKPAVRHGHGTGPEVLAYSFSAQVISFAYGNVKLHNPAITRDDVERVYEVVRSNLCPRRV